MGDALVAIDAGHSALRHGLVCTGRHRWLLAEIHRLLHMTAAAFGRVVRFQLLPNLLRELQAMTFILRRRVEFAQHMNPHFGVRLYVPRQPRYECRRYMAISAARLNAELI